MNDLREKIIISDNPLTTDLKKRCSLIDKITVMPLKERRLHYRELYVLLKDLLDNKNKNFNNFVNKTKEKNFLCKIEILFILDIETENFIKKIFSILTNNVNLGKKNND